MQCSTCKRTCGKLSTCIFICLITKTMLLLGAGKLSADALPPLLGQTQLRLYWLQLAPRLLLWMFLLSAESLQIDQFWLLQFFFWWFHRRMEGFYLSCCLLDSTWKLRLMLGWWDLCKFCSNLDFQNSSRALCFQASDMGQFWASANFWWRNPIDLANEIFCSVMRWVHCRDWCWGWWRLYMSLVFHKTLLAIDVSDSLFSFCDSSFFRGLDLLICAGALVWSFSPASDANELSLIPSDPGVVVWYVNEGNIL